MDLPDFGGNRDNQMRTSQQLTPNMLYAVIQGFIVLPKKNPIIVEE